MGPINYALKERGGALKILQNFGGAMLKIYVVNRSAAGAVQINLISKPGAPAFVPDYLDIPHKSSAFFTVNADCIAVTATNLGHNEGSAKISVTYE